jgi:predicted transcriptional regulator
VAGIISAGQLSYQNADMNILTLKVPEGMDAALSAASRARGVSKSALVREAIEQALGRHAEQAGTAARWVAQWRGSLSASENGKSPPKDDRLAHLLGKHLR